MSCSSLHILNSRGKSLISRDYRGDVPKSVVEKFVEILLENENEGLHSPVFTHSGNTYCYIKLKDLYFVTVTRKNANAILVFVLLYRIVKVMLEYFKELEEESVRDNFVLIYELLDEMVDFGYPQITESKILKEYILQKGYKLEKPLVPLAVTNAVSWRSDKIKHKRNEVFLDVVESVNLLANSNGNVLNCEIVGLLKMKVFLSGMPELRLGLNDKIIFDQNGCGIDKVNLIELEDVKFHQCVRLARFDQDRTISFIPPDGEFELMSYRLVIDVVPPIWVEAIVDKHAHSRIEYVVTVKSQFKKRTYACNVAVTIPVPCDVDSPIFRTSIGHTDYNPAENCMKWFIKSLPGDKEYVMKAHFNLPSIVVDDLDKKPLEVKFEIPYFTTSGIQVRYLKIIEKSGYQALPWVRYYTQSGDYQLRMR